MEQLIKDELFKNTDSFINELDLTMDYLSKDLITNVRDYLTKIATDSDELNLFVENTKNHLETFQVQISAILFSNKKVKSDYYNFMNDIVLFNNLLELSLFKDESKNTKKGLIKYVYSIYMSCVFLHQSQCEDENELSSKLSEFVEKIQNEANNALKEDDIKKTKRRIPRTQIPQNLPNFAGNGDLGNIMESLLGNKDILNIASDISQKMQSQQLNPMSMLSSLMSGNIENTPLQSLVDEIQQKVETKINNGEIDKDMLENQAKNIMGSITKNPNALNSMPGMSELINNMVNEMK